MLHYRIYAIQTELRTRIDALETKMNDRASAPRTLKSAQYPSAQV